MSGDPGLYGLRIAAAARALIGVQFRLHGRSPATGLDCIGLAASALEGAGLPLAVPNGYRLRNRTDDRWVEFLVRSGFRQLADESLSRDGDFWIVKPHPLQAHLLIAAGKSFIHADAGLERVVATPGPSRWPVHSIWRIIGA